jgi:ribonuclease HII
MTARQRERLTESLRRHAACAVGRATNEEIDAAGLIPATRRAMLRALSALPTRPDLLLLDAMALPEASVEQRSLVHGDALSASIAAASIIAKVERDQLMDAHDATYPQYGFAHNRGYCTRDHQRALEEHGPCPIHRRSFAPVRAWLEGRQLRFEEGEAAR